MMAMDETRPTPSQRELQRWSRADVQAPRRPQSRPDVDIPAPRRPSQSDLVDIQRLADRHFSH